LPCFFLIYYLSLTKQTNSSKISWSGWLHREAPLIKDGSTGVWRMSVSSGATPRKHWRYCLLAEQQSVTVSGAGLNVAVELDHYNFKNLKKM
jgi:hypothetical protein